MACLLSEKNKVLVQNLNLMKSVLIYCSFFTLVFISCNTLKIKHLVPRIHKDKSTKNNNPPEIIPQTESQTKSAKNPTVFNYIETYKNIAIREMNKSGIPASITLAQGILESANGNSQLAIEGNNHFGIKCTPEWKGKTILKDDDQKNDCFRVYKTPDESFRDHTDFLKRKRYAALFELDKDDYRGWAKGLKAAGYASNVSYADLLISLIERYHLNKFDQEETRTEKIIREDKILTEIVKNIPLEKKDESATRRVNMKIHEVKPGDTLFSIAKKFGLSVEEIMQLNRLGETILKPGQLLVVSK